VVYDHESRAGVPDPLRDCKRYSAGYTASGRRGSQTGNRNPIALMRSPLAPLPIAPKLG